MASKQYLNNKDLYAELVISKAQGRLTYKCSNMLYRLGKNIIRKFSYNDNDDREDCLQEGMYQVYKNWYLFDENITDNAFAYMTEVFKRGVAQGFNKVYMKKGDEYLSKRNVSMSSWGDEGYDMNI
jgi:excinuclease UvrABC nuclease subunit